MDIIQKYRPSNGTEGDIFFSGYCARCQKYTEQGCDIHFRAMANNVDSPDFPDEWQTLPPPDWGHCTAFVLDPTKSPAPMVQHAQAEKGITPKIDGVSGSFPLSTGKIVCVANPTYASVELCFESSMLIPFAKIVLYSKNTSVAAHSVFDDAKRLGDEIARRFNAQGEAHE